LPEIQISRLSRAFLKLRFPLPWLNNFARIFPGQDAFVPARALALINGQQLEKAWS
jgi:hypothetical protein